MIYKQKRKVVCKVNFNLSQSCKIVKIEDPNTPMDKLKRLQHKHLRIILKPILKQSMKKMKSK